MEVKRWEAYVSYFQSFENFYVHKKNDLISLQEISSSLQLLKDKCLKLDCIKPGDIVAAKYENDGLWYRAKILNSVKGAFTAQFIDYGNSELLSNFKKLPKKLASYHALAYQCTLDNVDEEYKIKVNNEAYYDIVFEFITSIEVVLTVLNYEEPYLVKMKWDERNIKVFLNNFFSYGITHQTYETLKKIDQIDKMMQVTLIYTESINEFYIETEDSEQIKNKIEYELENGKVWEAVIEYKIGKMVIAKRATDNRWYRVRILEINEIGITCYFIDYGIKEICTEFYEVFGYLKSAPPFIKRCSLHMPNVKKKKLFTYLSQSFVDEMAQYINQKMFIRIMKPGEPWVVELFVDGLNVAKVIEPKPVVIFQVNHVNAITIQVNSPGRLVVIDKLSKIENLPFVQKPQVDKIYGAFINNQWFRVKLMKSLSKKLMDVILVDYGGCIVQVEKLFALPKHIENVKFFFTHCSLGLDERYFSTQKLRQLCSKKTEFQMMVLQNNFIDGHCILIMSDGKDVKQLIKKD
ncbi:uncharacterized protein LOC112684302 [Sipha flava]|jgi:tudor domain-containing protein 1/4/6/7|uniref:Maternal protein tudor n=1 Tax=Sipha flava TaxID=143950 RepID=A0A2S2R972_9HEMI|nr:uncharacterized protein LOC112684302 [Sipha flava]XP_025411527.1 uncharacterized protein LOC112684302 [Sipha flava]XP_025411528.1 uncharacterized protein LOC112684302 [Sipha flava]XP_025411529.1 uncharacterized protein LOC112684302 [Sipha flava]XP_025411530.1 uncharacterized protein LOC112684302 [Sipha flava]XP_025411531.1 uncharacterized protein LOC112684302 [Sipha flava]XP_025411532.1 uncharacterized protein LOC112684302 [Sipha flava]